MLASDFYPMHSGNGIWHTVGMDADKFIARLRAKIDSDDDLTPSGLAIKAKVDNSTIRKLLSGENQSPRMATAEKICKALGTTLVEFMADHPDQPDPLRKELLDAYNLLEPRERRILAGVAKGMLAPDHEAG